MLLATNEADVAEEVAIRAAEALAPESERDLDGAALSGALWLVAAIAAARHGDAWTARDRLREHARPVAARTGEGNVFWTVFGPTNTVRRRRTLRQGDGGRSRPLSALCVAFPCQRVEI